MKISFDAQLLIKGNKTGIGWCAENILMKLPHIEGVKYQLNCFTLGYNTEQLKDIEKYQLLGYLLKKCTWFHDKIYKVLSALGHIPYSFLFGNDSDITVFFNYVIPPGVKGKKIVFIYDMVYKAYPETVRGRTKNILNISLKKSCDRADHIITISEFSKREIIKYLDIPESKITIMPCGVDLSTYHPHYSEQEIKKVNLQYKISGDYLLYLGTLEPRKNIERLVDAYSQLKDEMPNIPKLVLAGGKGWLYNNIFEKVKSLQIGEDVVFTGYVKAEDSPILIKGARAFLFPSIYEGFGMPPLEAMACGTPVLVSNVASLPEVVGDAGIQVDPFSIEGIKSGLKQIIMDLNLRKELSRKGLERVKTYTWDKSVEVVHKVLEEV